MKRIAKVIGIIFAGLIILLIGLNIFIKHYLNSDSFRAMIAREVENATQREMSLGKITYSIFPPSIIVRDVALKEKDKQTDFVALNEFSLLVDIGKREITSILLKKPAIRIVEYHDGTFNFSDMIPAPEEAAPASTAETARPAPQKAAPADVELKETALPLSIALIRVEDAAFTLIKVSEKGQETSFAIPAMNLSIRNITLDQPILTDLDMTIGAKSALQTTLSLGPLRTLPPDIANMPITLNGTLDIASFKDLEAFLTPEDIEQMPISSINATWTGSGNLAETFDFDLVLKTPPVGEKNKLHLNLDNRVTVSIPEAALNNILYGIPLPADMQPPEPPDSIADDEVCLISDPVTALLLSTLNLQTHITTGLLAYEKNELRDIDIGITLNKGKLSLSPLSLNAYQGKLSGSAELELTEYPMTYSLPAFNIESIQAADVIAANPDVLKGGFLEGFSGTLDIDINVAGQGFSEDNIQKNLSAGGHLLLADGQSVSTGGSFMDKLYLKLDNPILMQLLPELQPKIIEARANVTNETVTKLENVVFDFNMKQGTVNLTDFQAGTPDYLLKANGQVNPFEDTLDMKAQINLSSNVTMQLTDGKDRSDRLPYENGGLIIPLVIKGTMSKPIPRPNLDKIIRTMAQDETKSALTDALMKNTTEEDRAQINEGLNAVSEMLGVSQTENSDGQSSTNASAVEKGMNLINHFFGGEK